MSVWVVRVLFWSLGHDGKPNFSLPHLIIEFAQPNIEASPAWELIGLARQQI